MNRKYGIIILSIVLIACVSMIFVVQAKRQPQPSDEVILDVVSIGFDDRSGISRYEPPNPKVVTVWIFPVWLAR
jgi:hypothetical protein